MLPWQSGSAQVVAFLDSYLFAIFFGSAALRRGEWPANSPDLNPIEKLWNILQDRVIEEQAETVDELKAAVIKAWWDIPQSTIQHLISAVPNKILKCIEKEGGRTNAR